MKLFESATLKLTGWYLAIIMLISLSFSVVIYQISSNELQRGVSAQGGARVFIANPSGFEAYWGQRVKESNAALIRNLFVANIVTLVLGASASYFFARRSLQPIEEAMEQQGRFTSDASHELRTPLAVMKTELEVALRDPKLTKEDMHTLLRSNLEEVNRLQGLSERLLELANGHDIQLASIAIERSISQAVESVTKLAAQKGITIRQDIHSATVTADAQKLADMVAIVLDNAVKYSNEGSEVWVKTIKQGAMVLIQISDTGVGIKQADLPHIFDRFFRADTSRTSQHVLGYGLGLSIARRLADLHGGTITAQSSIGAGSTFTIAIPLASSVSSQ